MKNIRILYEVFPKKLNGRPYKYPDQPVLTRERIDTVSSHLNIVDWMTWVQCALKISMTMTMLTTRMSAASRL